MQISIAIRHGHLSEASQEKLREKVARVGRYFDRLMAIEVVVELTNEQAPRVEIMVSAEHKHDFVAHGTAKKFFPTVDSAVQKIEQQLRKYKDRVQKRHRNAGRNSGCVPGEIPDLTDEIPNTEESPDSVVEKTVVEKATGKKSDQSSEVGGI
ncbi:MAG: ribosome-associated translation inhibitor RaiA [Pirellulales bacterium]|nr:ribosome-associated translation inhibitor RaiA [Pirellulales bacterium]